MPPQKGLTNITKIVVLILTLFIAAIGTAVFYFKNTSTEQPLTVSPQKEEAKNPTITPLSGQKERDFQRMIGIKQLQAALTEYYNVCKGYPPMPRIAVFGAPLLDGTFNVGCPKGTSFGTISAEVNGTLPVNPTPGGVNYQYCSEAVPGSGKCGIPASGKVEGYIITFALEGPVDNLLAGTHTATPKGIE